MHAIHFNTNFKNVLPPTAFTRPTKGNTHFSLHLFFIFQHTSLLFLFVKALIHNDCLHQRHRRWSATCRQNATIATWWLEAERWLNLLNLLRWKSNWSKWLSHNKGFFLQTPGTCFLCFAVFWTNFIFTDFQSSSVCHQKRLCKMKSVAFLKLFAI